MADEPVCAGAAADALALVGVDAANVANDRLLTAGGTGTAAISSAGRIAGRSRAGRSSDALPG